MAAQWQLLFKKKNVLRSFQAEIGYVSVCTYVGRIESVDLANESARNNFPTFV